MKTGAQGLKGRAPHDHDDSLAVTVSHGDLQLIIDPGSHSYTLDATTRLSDVVSSRHNLVVPQQRERYNPTPGSVTMTARGAPTGSLSAYGSKHMSGVIKPTDFSKLGVSRCVNLTGRQLDILDSWHFDAAEEARTLWLFHPDWKFHVISECLSHDSVFEFRLKSLGVEVRGELSLPEGSAISYGEREYSPIYGKTALCPALWWRSMALQAGNSRLSLRY